MVKKALLYFVAGICFTLFIFGLFYRPKQPAPQVQITHRIDTVIVRVPQVKEKVVVKPLPAETVKTFNEIRVINWRSYTYEDKKIWLSITCDTLKEFSYVVKPQRQPTREVGLLVTPNAMLIHTSIGTHFLVGVGWNFRERTPEVMLGARIRF